MIAEEITQIKRYLNEWINKEPGLQARTWIKVMCKNSWFKDLALVSCSSGVLVKHTWTYLKYLQMDYVSRSCCECDNRFGDH